MHIKVELKSDLCISSGEGLSGIIDVDVIYDDNGIPYLPAKRFKGILREAAEDISDIYPEKYSQKIINDLFGDPETNSIGELYIDNGYIENYHTIANFIKICNTNKKYKNLFPKQYVKSYFTNIRQQTAIDRKNGISKDKSLRAIRTIKKGNLFYLNININSMIDYDKKVELLRNACKIIRHIGLSRTRGLGEVRCELIENNINEINKRININSDICDNNNKYKLTYIIELLSDTIVSNIGGNSNVTNSYIPGSNILGYFATQYIKNFKINDAENDPIFKRIFLSKDVSFLNAYPTDKENNDYIPVPVSIVKQKDKENYFDLAYDEDYQYIKEERVQTNSLSDNYINIQGEYINIINPKYVLHYHHKRPEDKSFGHATKKSGEFYSYLSLCAGEKFKGCVIGSKSDLGLIKELIPENSIIFIGKSKNAEYSRAKIFFEEIEMLDSEINIDDEEKLIITLTSPMILCNEYGNIDSDPRNFIKIIQEEYPSLVCNDKYFIRHVTVYGFNSKWGLPRQQVQALASGSVFVFDIKDKSNDFSGLLTKAYGLRTNEGFGRIAVNIHGFKPLEKKDNENDEFVDMNLTSQYVKPLIIYIEKEKFKKELIKKAISDAKNQNYGLKNMTNSTIGRLKTLLKKSNSEEHFKKLLSEEFKKERKINGIIKYLEDNTFINILRGLETYQTFKSLNINYMEDTNIVNELFAFYYTKLFNVLRYLKKEKKVQGMHDNKIERVIFVSGILKLETPCMIGSGNDTNTDIDVVKDNEDIPYVPGSSIAGVLRNFLSDGSKEDDEPEYVKYLFGKRNSDKNNDDGESTISSIYFYDLSMINYRNDRISTRDGVKLDYETKTSIENNKYDYEVIESGSCFLFRMEIQLRRKLSYLNDKVESILYKILYSMINGEIRLGGKTNRGLGKCTIDKNTIKILDLNFNDKEHLEENLNKWFNFDWDCFVGNKKLDELKHETHINNRKTIKVPLNIETSIIIRSYNNLENSDQKHITSNGIPVIPGTSWGGAIRSGCYKILKLFYDKLLKLDDYKINDKVNSNINCIFGYVDNESKKAKSSKILIEEAKINNGRTLYQTRVKIDRFTGGAAESALFNEEPIYGGETYLTIKVKSEEEWIIGLLILVIKDIQNGFIPVGGEASVGRGIMNEDKIYIDNEIVDLNTERKYLKSLYDFIVGGVSK